MNRDDWLLPDQNPPEKGNYLTQIAEGEQVILKWNGQDWQDGEDLFSGIVVAYQPLPPSYDPPESEPETKPIFCVRCAHKIDFIWGVNSGWRWKCHQCGIMSKSYLIQKDCEADAAHRYDVYWTPELQTWLEKQASVYGQTPAYSPYYFLNWLKTRFQLPGFSSS